LGKIRYLIYGAIITAIFVCIHWIFPQNLSLWAQKIDQLFQGTLSSADFGLYLGLFIFGAFLFFAFVLLYGINFLASFGKIKDPPGSENFSPPISILMPAFNEAKVIGNTFESFLKSNYPKENLEMIVIASGSTDETAAICEQYQDRLNITVLTDPLPKKGKPAALNLGLKYASHEIICIYDADTQMDKNTLSSLIRPLYELSITATSGPVLVRNWNTNTLTKGIALEYTYVSGTGLFFEIRARLGRALWVMGRNYAIRKQVIEEFGGWNEDALTEDLHLSAQLSASKKKIAFVPNAKIYENVPTNYKAFKKQRRRWVGGYKQGLEAAMKLDLRTVMLRNFGMMHYGNSADFSVGALITALIFGLIGEFYLMIICLAIFSFVFGTIINAVRKYGDHKYRLLLYYLIYIFVDLNMFSTQFKSIKELEWEKTTIE
jgi:cellulose synthase/poly-beta-1,6-N-acetylglucosamine synthase-like glycosyltransferase